MTAPAKLTKRASASHELTADRLTDLRLLATAATRRNGMLWECSRARMTWFEREGYIVLGPNPPAQHGRRRKVRRSVEVTAKGIAILADDDRRLIATARKAVERMWP